MKCNRAKIIFVGYANQGKSSLLHALKERSCLPKELSTATDGIELKTWTETNKEGETITFSSWDFAGQEVKIFE